MYQIRHGLGCVVSTEQLMVTDHCLIHQCWPNDQDAPLTMVELKDPHSDALFLVSTSGAGQGGVNSCRQRQGNGPCPDGFGADVVDARSGTIRSRKEGVHTVIGVGTDLSS